MKTQQHANEAEASVPLPPAMALGNPIAHLQAQFREFEGGFWSWLAAQPLAVEAAVVTVTTALQCAVIGCFICKLNIYNAKIQTLPLGTVFSRQVQVFAGRSLVVHALSFAVMTGTYAGIECILKRERGVDAMKNSMVAAFGSGAILSLMSGVEVSDQVTTAITLGALLTFAIIIDTSHTALST